MNNNKNGGVYKIRNEKAKRRLPNLNNKTVLQPTVPAPVNNKTVLQPAVPAHLNNNTGLRPAVPAHKSYGGIRCVFLKIAQGEKTPENAILLATHLHSYIVETTCSVRQTEHFLKLAYGKILFVHFFCCEVAQVTNDYIMDRYLKDALIAYIKLEFNVLNNCGYNKNEAYKSSLKYRVMTLLWTIYSKYYFYLTGCPNRIGIWYMIYRLLQDTMPPNISNLVNDILYNIRKMLPSVPKEPELPYCTIKCDRRKTVDELVIDLTGESDYNEKEKTLFNFAKTSDGLEKIVPIKTRNRLKKLQSLKPRGRPEIYRSSENIVIDLTEDDNSTEVNSKSTPQPIAQDGMGQCADLLNQARLIFSKIHQITGTTELTMRNINGNFEIGTNTPRTPAEPIHNLKELQWKRGLDEEACTDSYGNIELGTNRPTFPGDAIYNCKEIEWIRDHEEACTDSHGNTEISTNKPTSPEEDIYNRKEIEGEKVHEETCNYSRGIIEISTNKPTSPEEVIHNPNEIEEKGEYEETNTPFCPVNLIGKDLQICETNDHLNPRYYSKDGQAQNFSHDGPSKEMFCIETNMGLKPHNSNESLESKREIATQTVTPQHGLMKEHTNASLCSVKEPSSDNKSQLSLAVPNISTYFNKQFDTHTNEEALLSESDEYIDSYEERDEKVLLGEETENMVGQQCKQSVVDRSPAGPAMNSEEVTEIKLPECSPKVAKLGVTMRNDKQKDKDEISANVVIKSAEVQPLEDLPDKSVSQIQESEVPYSEENTQTQDLLNSQSKSINGSESLVVSKKNDSGIASITASDMLTQLGFQNGDSKNNSQEGEENTVAELKQTTRLSSVDKSSGNSEMYCEDSAEIKSTCKSKKVPTLQYLCNEVVSHISKSKITCVSRENNSEATILVALEISSVLVDQPSRDKAVIIGDSGAEQKHESDKDPKWLLQGADSEKDCDYDEEKDKNNLQQEEIERSFKNNSSEDLAIHFDKVSTSLELAEPKKGDNFFLKLTKIAESPLEKNKEEHSVNHTCKSEKISLSKDLCNLETTTLETASALVDQPSGDKDVLISNSEAMQEADSEKYLDNTEEKNKNCSQQEEVEERNSRHNFKTAIYPDTKSKPIAHSSFKNHSSEDLAINFDKVSTSLELTKSEKDDGAFSQSTKVAELAFEDALLDQKTKNKKENSVNDTFKSEKMPLGQGLYNLETTSLETATVIVDKSSEDKEVSVSNSGAKQEADSEKYFDQYEEKDEKYVHPTQGGEKNQHNLKTMIYTNPKSKLIVPSAEDLALEDALSEKNKTKNEEDNSVNYDIPCNLSLLEIANVILDQPGPQIRENVEDTLQDEVLNSDSQTELEQAKSEGSVDCYKNKNDKSLHQETIESQREPEEAKSEESVECYKDKNDTSLHQETIESQREPEEAKSEESVECYKDKNDTSLHQENIESHPNFETKYINDKSEGNLIKHKECTDTQKEENAFTKSIKTNDFLENDKKENNKESSVNICNSKTDRSNQSKDSTTFLNCAQQELLKLQTMFLNAERVSNAFSNSPAKTSIVLLTEPKNEDDASAEPITKLVDTHTLDSDKQDGNADVVCRSKLTSLPDLHNINIADSSENNLEATVLASPKTASVLIVDQPDSQITKKVENTPQDNYLRSNSGEEQQAESEKYFHCYNEKYEQSLSQEETKLRDGQHNPKTVSHADIESKPIAHSSFKEKSQENSGIKCKVSTGIELADTRKEDGAFAKSTKENVLLGSDIHEEKEKNTNNICKSKEIKHLGNEDVSQIKESKVSTTFLHCAQQESLDLQTMFLNAERTSTNFAPTSTNNSGNSSSDSPVSSIIFGQLPETENKNNAIVGSADESKEISLLQDLPNKTNSHITENKTKCVSRENNLATIETNSVTVDQPDFQLTKKVEITNKDVLMVNSQAVQEAKLKIYLDHYQKDIQYSPQEETKKMDTDTETQPSVLLNNNRGTENSAISAEKDLTDSKIEACTFARPTIIPEVKKVDNICKSESLVKDLYNEDDLQTGKKNLGNVLDLHGSQVNEKVEDIMPVDKNILLVDCTEVIHSDTKADEWNQVDKAGLLSNSETYSDCHEEGTREVLLGVPHSPRALLNPDLELKHTGPLSFDASNANNSATSNKNNIEKQLQDAELIVTTAPLENDKQEDQKDNLVNIVCKSEEVSQIKRSKVKYSRSTSRGSRKLQTKFLNEERSSNVISSDINSDMAASDLLATKIDDKHNIRALRRSVSLKRTQPSYSEESSADNSTLNYEKSSKVNQTETKNDDDVPAKSNTNAELMTDAPLVNVNKSASSINIVSNVLIRPGHPIDKNIDISDEAKHDAQDLKSCFEWCPVEGKTSLDESSKIVGAIQTHDDPLLIPSHPVRLSPVSEATDTISKVGFRNLKDDEMVVYVPGYSRHTPEQFRILKEENSKERDDPRKELEAIKNNLKRTKEIVLNLSSNSYQKTNTDKLTDTETIDHLEYIAGEVDQSNHVDVFKMKKYPEASPDWCQSPVGGTTGKVVGALSTENVSTSANVENTNVTIEAMDDFDQKFNFNKFVSNKGTLTPTTLKPTKVPSFYLQGSQTFPDNKLMALAETALQYENSDIFSTLRTENSDLLDSSESDEKLELVEPCSSPECPEKWIESPNKAVVAKRPYKRRKSGIRLGVKRQKTKAELKVMPSTKPSHNPLSDDDISLADLLERRTLSQPLPDTHETRKPQPNKTDSDPPNRGSRPFANKREKPQGRRNRKKTCELKQMLSNVHPMDQRNEEMQPTYTAKLRSQSTSEKEKNIEETNIVASKNRSRRASTSSNRKNKALKHSAGGSQNKECALPMENSSCDIIKLSAKSVAEEPLGNGEPSGKATPSTSHSKKRCRDLEETTKRLIERLMGQDTNTAQNNVFLNYENKLVSEKSSSDDERAAIALKKSAVTSIECQYEENNVSAKNSNKKNVPEEDLSQQNKSILSDVVDGNLESAEKVVRVISGEENFKSEFSDDKTAGNHANRDVLTKNDTTKSKGSKDDTNILTGGHAEPVKSSTTSITGNNADSKVEPISKGKIHEVVDIKSVKAVNVDSVVPNVIFINENTTHAISKESKSQTNSTTHITEIIDGNLISQPDSQVISKISKNTSIKSASDDKYSTITKASKESLKNLTTATACSNKEPVEKAADEVTEMIAECGSDSKIEIIVEGTPEVSKNINTVITNLIKEAATEGFEEIQGMSTIKTIKSEDVTEDLMAENGTDSNNKIIAEECSKVSENFNKVSTISAISKSSVSKSNPNALIDSNVTISDLCKGPLEQKSSKEVHLPHSDSFIEVFAPKCDDNTKTHIPSANKSSDFDENATKDKHPKRKRNKPDTRDKSAAKRKSKTQPERTPGNACENEIIKSSLSNVQADSDSEVEMKRRYVKDLRKKESLRKVSYEEERSEDVNKPFQATTKIESSSPVQKSCNKNSPDRPKCNSETLSKTSTPVNKDSTSSRERRKTSRNQNQREKRSENKHHSSTQSKDPIEKDKSLVKISKKKEELKDFLQDKGQESSKIDEYKKSTLSQKKNNIQKHTKIDTASIQPNKEIKIKERSSSSKKKISSDKIGTSTSTSKNKPPKEDTITLPKSENSKSSSDRAKVDSSVKDRSRKGKRSSSRHQDSSDKTHEQHSPRNYKDNKVGSKSHRTRDSERKSHTLVKGSERSSNRNTEKRDHRNSQTGSSSEKLPVKNIVDLSDQAFNQCNVTVKRPEDQVSSEKSQIKKAQSSKISKVNDLRSIDNNSLSVLDVTKNTKPAHTPKIASFARQRKDGNSQNTELSSTYAQAVPSNLEYFAGKGHTDDTNTKNNDEIRTIESILPITKDVPIIVTNLGKRKLYVMLGTRAVNSTKQRKRTSSDNENVLGKDIAFAKAKKSKTEITTCNEPTRLDHGSSLSKRKTSTPHPIRNAKRACIETTPFPFNTDTKTVPINEHLQHIETHDTKNSPCEINLRYPEDPGVDTKNMVKESNEPKPDHPEQQHIEIFNESASTVFDFFGTTETVETSSPLGNHDFMNFSFDNNPFTSVFSDNPSDCITVSPVPFTSFYPIKSERSGPNCDDHSYADNVEKHTSMSQPTEVTPFADHASTMDFITIKPEKPTLQFTSNPLEDSATLESSDCINVASVPLFQTIPVDPTQNSKQNLANDSISSMDSMFSGHLEQDDTVLERSSNNASNIIFDDVNWQSLELLDIGMTNDEHSVTLLGGTFGITDKGSQLQDSDKPIANYHKPKEIPAQPVVVEVPSRSRNNMKKMRPPPRKAKPTITGNQNIRVKPLQTLLTQKTQTKSKDEIKEDLKSSTSYHNEKIKNLKNVDHLDETSIPVTRDDSTATYIRESPKRKGTRNATRQYRLAMELSQKEQKLDLFDEVTSLPSNPEFVKNIKKRNAKNAKDKKQHKEEVASIPRQEFIQNPHLDDSSNDIHWPPEGNSPKSKSEPYKPREFEDIYQDSADDNRKLFWPPEGNSPKSKSDPYKSGGFEDIYQESADDTSHGSHWPKGSSSKRRESGPNAKCKSEPYTHGGFEADNNRVPDSPAFPNQTTQPQLNKNSVRHSPPSPLFEPLIRTGLKHPDINTNDSYEWLKQLPEDLLFEPK